MRMASFGSTQRAKGKPDGPAQARERVRGQARGAAQSTTQITQRQNAARASQYRGFPRSSKVFQLFCCGSHQGRRRRPSGLLQMNVHQNPATTLKAVVAHYRAPPSAGTASAPAPKQSRHSVHVTECRDCSGAVNSAAVAQPHYNPCYKPCYKAMA